MATTSPVLGGILLIAAGTYQWLPFKSACLGRCRSPLHFVSTEWREGHRGAFVMGWRHGLFCLGCCWALMALFIAFGVMNVWVMIGLAAIVAAEKILRSGELIGRVAGVAFVVLGALILLSPSVADALIPAMDSTADQMMMS